jgi:hypothetical protein
MSDIYEIIKAPEWWITVVIAGIGINLFSSYLRGILDARFSRISIWWRSRSLTRQQETDSYIARLSEEPQFLLLNSIRHARSVKYAIIWILIGLMGFLSTQGLSSENSRLLFMFICSVCFFRGFQHMLKASYYSECAEEAIDSKST